MILNKTFSEIKSLALFNNQLDSKRDNNIIEAHM